MLNEAELFCRFIDDITWISASEISNERNRHALTSAFPSSGLELKFLELTCKKTLHQGNVCFSEYGYFKTELAEF